MTTLILSAILTLTLASCAGDTDGLSQNTADNTALVTTYDYKADELELIRIINKYRISSELNQLQLINHISYKAQQHNNYMIDHNVVNHDNFSQRADNLKQVLGALTVGENVAYNFSTPQAALNAWLQSPGHRQNLEGDYSHFGLSITADATGKKYYTNIFIKK